jgi:hypothetical protein
MSLLPRLRIAAPIQLPLGLPEVLSTPSQRWCSLPDAAQREVLSLLARMITAGVVDEKELVDGDGDG